MTSVVSVDLAEFETIVAAYERILTRNADDPAAVAGYRALIIQGWEALPSVLDAMTSIAAAPGTSDTDLTSVRRLLSEYCLPIPERADGR